MTKQTFIATQKRDNNRLTAPMVEATAWKGRSSTAVHVSQSFSSAAEADFFNSVTAGLKACSTLSGL